MKTIVLATLLCLMAASAFADTPELAVAIDRVSDRVVVAQYRSNNVTAIATGRGVIVIDSHRSPTIMRAVLKALEDELGRGDFKWLVNTHGHWDHTWGNQALEGVTHMGHALCATHIEGHDAHARMTTWRQENELALARAKLETVDETSPQRVRAQERVTAQEIIVDDLHYRFVPTPPTETFTDRARIEGGDVTADLIFCGAAHTDHDVFVFVPEENLLLVGDVFCSKNAVCFNVNALADADRLKGVIDEILARASEDLVIVPGHGEWLFRDDLVNLRTDLERRATNVRADASAALRVALGQSLDDAEAELYFDEVEFHVLARRHIGHGRLGSALEVLELAVKHLPDSALLHDILGETHFHMGNTAGARSHYQRSLELSPDNRNATRILERLADEQ